MRGPSTWARRRSTDRQDGRAQQRALARMPVFSNCTDAELALVDALTTELRLSGGRVLARQGQPAREVIFVVSGRVALARDARAVEILDGDACIGAPECFACESHKASAVTLTDVTLRVSSPREARSLVHAVPRLAHLGLAGAHDAPLEDLPIEQDHQMGAIQ